MKKKRKKKAKERGKEKKEKTAQKRRSHIASLSATSSRVVSDAGRLLLLLLFGTVDDVFFLSRACFVSFSSTFFAASVRRGVLSRARASLSVVRTVPLNGQKERETKRWSIGIIIITVRRRGARRSVRSTGTPRGKIRTQAKMLWQRREGTFFVLALKYYFTRDDVMMI